MELFLTTVNKRLKIQNVFELSQYIYLLRFTCACPKLDSATLLLIYSKNVNAFNNINLTRMTY
jgi:hypothetical protein